MTKLNNRGAIDHMLIIAIIAVLAVGGFVFYRVSGAESNITDTVSDTVSNTTDTMSDTVTETVDTVTDEIESEDEVEEETAEETETSNIPEGWIEYTNQDIGFSFAYPEEWGEVELGEPRTGTESPAEGGLRQAISFDCDETCDLGLDSGIPEGALNSRDFSGVGTGRPLALASGWDLDEEGSYCLLYTSPSPRDATLSRMPSSA